jgi:hypothetical protein
MQTGISDEPPCWGCLPTFSIFLGVVIAGSIPLAIHWQTESLLPITAERYKALCNDVPECDPQIGYTVGALLMFVTALIAGVLLALTLGVIWLRRRLGFH